MATILLQVAAAVDAHKPLSTVKDTSTSTTCLLWSNLTTGSLWEVLSKSGKHNFWATLISQNSDLIIWMKAAENEQLQLVKIKEMANHNSKECPAAWEIQLEHNLNYLKYVISSLKTSILFRKYLDPIVYTLVSAMGLFGNGAMLVIMATKPEMRTGPNLLLMNLVIGDMLNLAINLPLFYVRHQIPIDKVTCYIFTTLRPMFVANSALSVVVLSLQRCRASINWSVTQSHERFYIPAVWLTSLVIAFPYSFAIHYENGNCFRCRDHHVAKVIASLEFLLYCILLPVVVTVLLCIAAQNIKNSIPDNPYDHLQKNRSRSANVLIGLVAVFLISYCPHHTWRLTFYWLQLDIWDYRCRCVDKITYYLLFANPCLNPFALFALSSNFRTHIRNSLSACCNKRWFSSCGS